MSSSLSAGQFVNLNFILTLEEVLCIWEISLPYPWAVAITTLILRHACYCPAPDGLGRL